MFATQRYLEAVDAGRKRFRDDEEIANAAAGFGEHRNKRIQSLPLRAPPRPAQHSPSPSVVPLNASSSSAGPRPHLEPFQPPSGQDALLQQDAEMDMMDTTISPPLDQDGVAQPPALLLGRSTARMPTPIQPHFAAQVRGQHSGWAADLRAQTTPNGVANLGHHVMGISQEQSVSRAMTRGPDWQTLQNHRRPPSPISEMSDPSMQDGSDIPTCVMMDSEDHLGQQSQLSPVHGAMSGHPSPLHAMEHPNAMIDSDSHHLLLHGESDIDLSTPSPTRKGHQRSKHTVNSWTWQPGMKKSFSIGYRSDCEKCRLKVPGHFNHIVIS
ncbi:uncharacterized protein MAM_00616 [Metarhizium album ARSEF 1941]|uniref:Uncharacterized protein n=1 Tax=Metarhizium album (strain ARSEF 1941) TaxID=1081103 RepID=A0A0B2X7Y1_METAS|nr:uncharacterized protein MAM_00616 [Metarhizium album ARSEF 1941]KHO01615.1 hypothetical protein MAM_00616 [Metarhizium album ARSEF 1941]